MMPNSYPHPNVRHTAEGRVPTRLTAHAVSRLVRKRRTPRIIFNTDTVETLVGPDLRRGDGLFGIERGSSFAQRAEFSASAIIPTPHPARHPDGAWGLSIAKLRLYPAPLISRTIVPIVDIADMTHYLPPRATSPQREACYLEG